MKSVFPSTARTSTPLSLRAVFSFVITAVYFVLIFAGGIFLIWIPFHFFQQNSLAFLAVLCFSLGLVAIVLKSAIPRFDRIIPPGPQLTPESQKKLFEIIEKAAREARQPRPQLVYLTPDVNLFYAVRGGFLGIGGKRVLGIGLPLFEALTPEEFLVALTREFGLSRQGSIVLGPWVYHTRAAVVRISLSLGARSTYYFIFKLYARFFLRLTQPVSRQQELEADRFVRDTAEPALVASTLCTSYGASVAYQAYLQHEFLPVIDAGYRPPLADGFAAFLGTPQIMGVMERLIHKDLQKPHTTPLEDHPTLGERLEKLQLSPPQIPANRAQAAVYLNNLSGLERQLLNWMFGEHRVQDWRPIAWENVGRLVYLPVWEKTVKRYANALQGLTSMTLIDFIKSPDPLWKMLKESSENPLTKNELRQGVMDILAMSLAVNLARQGWSVSTSPGDTISLWRGQDEIQPFVTIAQLATGEIDAWQWQSLCVKYGFSGQALGETSS